MPAAARPDRSPPQCMPGSASSQRPTYTDARDGYGCAVPAAAVGLRDERRPSGDRRGEGRRGVRRGPHRAGGLLLLLFGSVAAFVGYLGYTVNDNVTQEQPASRPSARRSTAPTGRPSTRRAPARTSSSSAPTRARVTPAGPTSSSSCTSPRTRVDPDDPLPARPLRRRPGPRQGQDQRRLRVWQGAAPRPDDGEPAQGPHPPRRQDQLRRLQEHDGCRRRRPRVRRGGEQRHRQRRAVVIKKGWNDLNGEQALGFVRERHTLSEGDISRGRRQLSFIKALLLKATSPETVSNPLTIAKFTDAATENLVLDQDLSVGDMRDYALQLRNIRVRRRRLRDRTVHRVRHLPEGASIDVVDTKGHGRPRRGPAHRHHGRLRRRLRHPLSRVSLART